METSMNKFVIIKGLDMEAIGLIYRTLQTIRSGMARGSKDVVPHFETWYSSMMGTIQKNDLYNTVGISQEHMMSRLQTIEDFRQSFTEKFTAQFPTRKVIKGIRDSLKDRISREYETYFGDMSTITDIDSMFSLYYDYAKFIITLYDDIVYKLHLHVQKEQKEVTEFMAITKITGTVTYFPQIGGEHFLTLPFVSLYRSCTNAVKAIELWNKLKVYETNIPIATSTNLEVSKMTPLDLNDSVTITRGIIYQESSDNHPC